LISNWGKYHTPNYWKNRRGRNILVVKGFLPPIVEIDLKRIRKKPRYRENIRS
jgi:hypothetical protein